MKRLAKSVARQAGGLAKSVAKQVAQDVGEIPKDVGKDIIGVKTGDTAPKESPIVEAMQQSDGKTLVLSKEEEDKITQEGLERVKKLETEIDKHRQQRIVRETESQQVEPANEEQALKLGESVIPSSKPTRGAVLQSPAERKKRKIESRLGKS